MPIVGNFYKGLTVSIPFHASQLAAGTDAARVHATLAARYADEPFINVMPLSDPAVLAEGSFDVQACN